MKIKFPLCSGFLSLPRFEKYELHNKALKVIAGLLLYLLPLLTFASNQHLPLLYIEDKGYELKDVISLPVDSFTPSSTTVLNLGLSSSSYWIKIAGQELDEVIVLEYPLLDKVSAYILNDKEEVLRIVHTGDMIPFSSRLYPNQLFVFKLPEDAKSVYINVFSHDHLIIPIRTLDNANLLKQLSAIDLFFGAFFGIIIALLFYNTFLFFTVKEKAYSFYIMYLLFILFSHASLNGFHSRVLFPDAPVFANRFLLISTALSGVFAISFAIHFLRVRFYAPVFYWPLRFFQMVYVILIVVTFFHLSSRLTSYFDILALFLALYGFAFSVAIARKRYRPAYFFLAAWSVFLIGLTIFTLRNFGLLPYSFITNHMVQIGVASEVLLLSFALADRIKILQKEKDRTQKVALDISLENERIIREQNALLENRVRERTQDLIRANRTMEETVSALKETQTQMVEQEKMASLGQLTAGIAHEINNPINFVINNLKPLKLDINDIFALQQRAEEILEEVPELLRKFNDEKEKIDYEFVVNEINELIEGIDEGARRTSQIVVGLRSFSRLDEEDAKQADISEGIRSTLVLLNNKTKGIIEIVEEYDDNNVIECYPGKLNQVFMNLFSNAIDALNSRVEEDIKHQPKIWIKTLNTGEKLQIFIKDNGIGMPEEVKQKIFDPFFTTKDVGKGTGLGMSIVFKIIQAHKGQFKIDSAPGVGTEITVSLPLIINSESD